MSYEASVQQLYALGHELASTPSHKFDLAYVREMLSALGNPERRFPSVLIAGTNGKGSTAATLASILRAAGYKAGLYSSPHLININERIRVNGEAIADVEFSEIHDRIEQVAQRLLQEQRLPWHPSFFEILTVMAFEYFASIAVDIAVLEVGMGGAWTRPMSSSRRFPSSPILPSIIRSTWATPLARSRAKRPASFGQMELS